MKISTIIIFLLTLFSCGQKKEKFKPDPFAKQLNDSAVRLAQSMDSAKIIDAIALLGKATEIQPDYYKAHWNKMVFQNQLGLTQDAFKTLEKLESLRPYNPDLKMTAGIYMANNGDSLAARHKFISADSLYQIILDTLSVKSDPNQSTLTSRAINLKLLGNNNEGNELLAKIKQQQSDPILKEIIDSVANRTRTELLFDFNTKNKHNP